MNKEIEELILKINEYQTIKLMIVKNEIEYIINNNIISQIKIESVFDKLLDLTYWYGSDIESLFYKFIEYYKNINNEVCNDYEKYYKKILKF